MSERRTYIQPHHQSSISMCMGCKRCYMFQYRWCLKLKKTGKVGATSQGHITHRMLQLGPEGMDTVREEVWKDINEAISHIEAGEDLLGEWQARAKELEEHFYKARAICQLFWSAHPVPQHHKTIAREKEVGFRLRVDKPQSPGDEGIVTELMGTIDHMFHDEKTDRIFVRDYKTSTRDPFYTTTGYQWSYQCRLYRLLAGAYLQEYKDERDNYPFRGRSVNGFVLDVLQIPGIILTGKDRDYKEEKHEITRGKRKGEIDIKKEYYGRPKFENYLKRVSEWYSLQEAPPIQSNCVLYTEPTFPDELKNDLRIAEVYRTIEAVPANFPRDLSTSYCTYYQRQCKYYDLCSSNPLNWDEVIEQKYDVVVPDSAKEVS